MHRSTFAFYASRVLAGVLAAGASAAWAQELLLQLYPPGQLPPPALSLNFVTGNGFNGTASGAAASMLTVVRAQPVGTTDLLPASSATYAYQTFAAATPRTTPGLGLLIEGTRTNSLLNSTAPATQTTGSLANGTYTLWVNGTGSAALTNGTATGCAGTATTGNPVTFTTTGTAGTCVVTVTGTLRAFQLELGAAGSSLIVTVAAAAARNVDNVTLTGGLTISASYSTYARTMYLTPDNYPTGSQTSLQVDDGTNTNRSGLFRFAPSNISAAVNSGTAGVTTQNTGLLPHQGIPAKQASAVTTNFQASTQDGIQPALSAGAYTPPPGMNTVRLGGNATGNAQACYCYIQEIKLWPAITFTMPQLQQLTSIYSQ